MQHIVRRSLGAVLIATLLCMSSTVGARQKNIVWSPDELEQIRSTVQSLLPSDWKVVGARSQVSFWPYIAELKDRYEGYAIDLAGPNYTAQKDTKGNQEGSRRVTHTRAAVFYLIPVWKGISGAQISRDWDKSRRRYNENERSQGTESSFPLEARPYGWNSKYLLVGKGEYSSELLALVAQKFNIPRRAY